MCVPGQRLCGTRPFFVLTPFFRTHTILTHIPHCNRTVFAAGFYKGSTVKAAETVRFCFTKVRVAGFDIKKSFNGQKRSFFIMKKTKLLAVLAAIIGGLLCLAGCNVESDNPSDSGTPPSGIAPVTGKTAAEIVRAMGAGWNLGNTLDACNDNSGYQGLETETSWGNPKTTKDTIKTVADAGFKSIRIPVSWHNHLTNEKIDAAWIARVKEIVDWALECNLYAVINIHHDTWNASGDFWGYYPDNAHKEKSIKYVKNIWQQVAEKFSSYDQRLIFETLNEPRLRGTKHEWWCDYLQNGNCSQCSEAVEIVNELNKAALETIRAAGGKNSSRLVIVPSYVASPDYAFKDSFKFPSDSANMIALSTHMYTPNDFAMKSPGDTVFSDKHKDDLTYYFDTLNSKFVQKDVPVFIGEYGATNKNNKDERIKWVKFFIENASKYKMSPCLWDNNNYAVSEDDSENKYEEKFGYLNRKTLQWYDKDFINAIMTSFK